jgi:hypothetical protein
MMWVMMRGMDHGQKPDPRVAELESQVAELRSAVARPGQSHGSQPESEATTAERV